MVLIDHLWWSTLATYGGLHWPPMVVYIGHLWWSTLATYGGQQLNQNAIFFRATCALIWDMWQHCMHIVEGRYNLLLCLEQCTRVVDSEFLQNSSVHIPGGFRRCNAVTMQTQRFIALALVPDTKHHRKFELLLQKKCHVIFELYESGILISYFFRACLKMILSRFYVHK
jgi:hypothetical protein